jgi:hypothetical protein
MGSKRSVLFPETLADHLADEHDFAIIIGGALDSSTTCPSPC